MLEERHIVNNKIPKLAYIQAQIVNQSAKQGLLNETARTIEKEYKMKDGILGNGVFFQSSAISLLYSLIVVPREFWKLGQGHSIYSEIGNIWSIESVIIVKDKSDFKDPVYKFVHHLRNAIAHANFKFCDNHFEFWDKFKEKPEKFRARISHDDLNDFLEKVGSMFANYDSLPSS